MEIITNKHFTMRKNILNFPTQFKAGLKLAKDIKLKHGFQNVIISGMGGSAWPANLLKAWLDLPINITVNRTYDLPPQATKKTLAIFSSYSGNTEEPISVYRQTIKKKIPSVIITSGGKFKELAKKNNTPLILMPAGLQPRMATGYMFSILYAILINAKLVKNKSNELIKNASELKPEKLEQKGKKIATKLFNKIPIIYAPDKYRILGYVWKIKFNENTKIPAFCHYFAELNHNEMNGWQNPLGKFSIITLRDPDDHPQMLKRIKLTASLLKPKGIKTEIINMDGKSDLEKLFNTTLLADWVSYYLALKYKTDPVKVKLVEDLKKKL